jgi:transposase
LPIAAEITAGEVSDYSGFAPLMEADGPEPKVVLSDRGYDSDHIRETLEQKRAATVIPTRKNRKVQIPVDGYIYALRNRIERCFNKLKNSRRLATRYDKTAAVSRLRPYHRHPDLDPRICQQDLAFLT